MSGGSVADADDGPGPGLHDEVSDDRDLREIARPAGIL